MQRIDVGFKVFKGLFRCQIIGEHCPKEIDDNLEDFDINTYIFSGQGKEVGCRGITCTECWEKEYKKDT